jgi:hypothetical protein
MAPVEVSPLKSSRSGRWIIVSVANICEDFTGTSAILPEISPFSTRLVVDTQHIGRFGLKKE